MSGNHTDALSKPLELPCGRVAPNRLMKAPLEEMLCTMGENLPNDKIFNLYRSWAKGGWGIIVTGNVAIDATHLGTPFDVVIPTAPEELASAKVADRFKQYAQTVKGVEEKARDPSFEPPLAVVQLVHAGRQSMRGSGRSPFTPPMAPSAVAMRTSSSLLGPLIDAALWNTPRAMTKDEIHWLVRRFADAAHFCHESGFDGVEIHASHGYQIAAFLSPRTNVRTDEYGGSAANRARILVEIIDAVRRRVPKSFVVGVKLNSSDYVQGGLTEDDALTNVQTLAQHGGVDYIQISGGNYENPSFMLEKFDAEEETARINAQSSSSKPKAKAQFKPKPSERTAKREAFFQQFAQRARGAVEKSDSRMALFLVGGLRTRTGMADPIEKGFVDGVGLGRVACVYPDAPKTLLDSSVADDDSRSSPAPYVVTGAGFISAVALTLINAGWTTLWHGAMLGYIARNERPNVKANPAQILATVFTPNAGIVGPLTVVVVALAIASYFWLR